MEADEGTEFVDLLEYSEMQRENDMMRKALRASRSFIQGTMDECWMPSSDCLKLIYTALSSGPTDNVPVSDDVELWQCPVCGCEETWFDRSVAYCDGVEEGPTTRCAGCGRDVDEEDVDAH